MATCLSLAYHDPHHGDLSTPQKTGIALRAYEKMRYERVKAAQRQGEEVMKNWHRKDEEEWAEAKKKPESMKLPREGWLLDHDSEEWCRGVWEAVRGELNGGEAVRRGRLAAGPEGLGEGS